MRRVLEDSVREHDRTQWEGLGVMMALSAAGDVVISELEVKEEVVEPDVGGTVMDVDIHGAMQPTFTASLVGGRRAVVTIPTATISGTAAPIWQPMHAPLAHHWQPPQYMNLTMDEDDEDGDE